MSLPARTAYVADHGSVTCAVVVESGESAGLRDEVRDIIAEYAAPAAKEAGGMEHDDPALLATQGPGAVHRPPSP